MAIPIFIVGMQRSGTNLLFFNFENDTRFEVYNEDNPLAFLDYKLISVQNTAELINKCQKPYIVFKSLSEVMQSDALLNYPNAKVIWMLRSLPAVAFSHIDYFGDKIYQEITNHLENITLGKFSSKEWKSKFYNEEEILYRQSIMKQYIMLVSEKVDSIALFWIYIQLQYFRLDFDKNINVKIVKYEDLATFQKEVFVDIGKFLEIKDFKCVVPLRDRANIREFFITESLKLLGDLTYKSICLAESEKWNKVNK